MQTVLPQLRGGRYRSQWHALNADLAQFGGLNKFILNRYDAGDVARHIADRLFAMGGIRVTDQTVRNWLRQALAERYSQTSTSIGEKNQEAVSNGIPHQSPVG